MEVFNDFADKLMAIERMRGISDWRVKQECKKDEPNTDVIDKQVEVVQNCTRKINAFFRYAEEHGCKWSDFLSSYNRKQKQSLVNDPNQDIITASLKRIAEKKKKLACEQREMKEVKKALKDGYSKEDIEKKPEKHECDDE